MKRQALNSKKRIILGITGSFGSGKTTVARMFASPKAKIIDADRIVHSIIQPKGKIYKRIVSAFGSGILQKNRHIDRNRLAKIVFNNKNLLNRLNRIIHPEVVRMIKNQIKTSPKKLIILDAPLLIEVGLKQIADKLIVVKIARNKQITRLKEKLRLSKTDILKRIRCQMSLAQKVRLADFIIDNSATIKETKKQVERIRRILWKN